MVTSKVLLPWVDNKKRVKPTAIVLHWWGPFWPLGMKWFLFVMRKKDVSVQFAVMKDGLVYQFVKSADVLCHHARCANQTSIGIEIQGWGSRNLSKNNNQFTQVVALINKLRKDYNIESSFYIKKSNQLEFFGVTSHKVIDTYCYPKRFFKKRDVSDEYLSIVLKAIE